ncbi:MAG: hypothetical protein EBT45_06705, partial [Alphaproteobacteria bacterium]|nr:hypothetical protein [Alphaproteobacteria bacterium]
MRKTLFSSCVPRSTDYFLSKQELPLIKSFFMKQLLFVGKILFFWPVAFSMGVEEKSELEMSKLAN